MMRARFPSSSSHSFFSPSYRALPRGNSAFNPSSPASTSAKGKGRSISCSSGGSSSRSGSNSRPVKPANPTSTRIKAATPKHQQPKTLTINPSSPPSVPLAPPLPHQRPQLVVSLDSFFALHRPLLELPLRLSARKSVAPIAHLSTSALDAEDLERDDLDLQESFSPDEVREAVVSSEAGDELVEVVDLGTDGKPTGPSYLTTINTMTAANGNGKMTNEEVQEELNSWREVEDEEASLQQDESTAGHGPDATPYNPYDAWMIGESEQSAGEIPLTIARYLAARQPFTTPSPPTASPSTPSIRTEKANADARLVESYLTPKALKDMSFLRPFHLPPQSKAAFSLETKADVDFLHDFSTPLTPSQSQAITAQFLSSFALGQLKKDYRQSKQSTEKMDVALNSYRSPPPPSIDVAPASAPSMPALNVHSKASLKEWVAKHLNKPLPTPVAPLFVPAETFNDAMWEKVKGGEFVHLGELTQKLEEVTLDSVKRKRKKKITKHKYKKRRKAQKALRQRLGK